MRIQGKLHGWRSKTLNHVGKKVLIKSVIITIPTYAMSVFSLPQTWCYERNAMIADFWWGRSNIGRTIHWSWWDYLTESKGTGGIGFREIQTFNRTLLTKMVTRVLDEPTSLWVWVLKSIYFPNGEFLSATKGSHNHGVVKYACRSRHHQKGRDLEDRERLKNSSP